MLWKGFQRPKRVEVEHESLTPTYGKFVAQPFERGFATTVGNALRRCLLSSIEGAAITAIEIEGVQHEFSSIPGVKEDVTDIVLNLKQIPVRLLSEDSKILSLDVKGPRVVRAKDLAGDPQIEISDPEAHVATVNEEGHLRMQAVVQRGRGYVTSVEHLELAVVATDARGTPIRIRDVADVTVGGNIRRGLVDLDGRGEVVGGERRVGRRL